MHKKIHEKKVHKNSAKIYCTKFIREKKNIAQKKFREKILHKIHPQKKQCQKKIRKKKMHKKICEKNSVQNSSAKKKCREKNH